MFDNAIFKLLIPALSNGIARLNLGVGVEIKQNFQPTAQGIDSGPTLYFTKLFDHPYGWPQRSADWDEAAGDYVQTTRQLMESTFQMTGVYRQSAADTDGLTAADLANVGRGVLQQDETLAELLEGGLSVLRITQVRNVEIINGERQNEALPSFDFVLKHEQVTVTATPRALVKDFRVKSV